MARQIKFHFSENEESIFIRKKQRGRETVPRPSVPSFIPNKSTGVFKVKSFFSRRRRLSVYCKRAEPEVPEGAENNEKNNFSKKTGGEGEIRTLDTVSRMQSFQDCALNRSATSPKGFVGKYLYYIKLERI